MSQTVFPGVHVMSIDTKESVRQRGVEGIKEIPDVLTPEFIQERVGEDRDKLVYTLVISAVSKRTAVAKAKAFVRAKNPFEVGRIDLITEPIERQDGFIMNKYTVTIGVAKDGVL